MIIEYMIIVFNTLNNMNKFYIIFKRIIDVLFSILVLIVMSPLLLIICLSIKLTSKGPIFYMHKRIGSNKKYFDCIKFRTMILGSDKLLTDLLKNNLELKKEFERIFKLKNDPRMTSFGKFLRKTSLDELPQFINVITGQMSVVGPRPIVEDEKVRYGEEMLNLLSVKPGITGLWQVEGRSSLSYVDRKKLDLYYANNISLKLDLYIFFKTIFVLIFPKNKGAF